MGASGGGAGPLRVRKRLAARGSGRDDSKWFADHNSSVKMVRARASGSREQPARAGTGAAPTAIVPVCQAGNC